MGCLDLNDVQRFYDRDELISRLRSTARQWVPTHFPNGRESNGEWRLASIDGRRPSKQGSCVIPLSGDRAGSWHDYSPEDGGDPIDTIGHATHTTGREKWDAAAALVGLEPTEYAYEYGSGESCTYLPQDADNDNATDPANAILMRSEVDWLVRRSQSAHATIAATYLTVDRSIPEFPDCIRWNESEGAMVALATDAQGEVQAVQLVYLSGDGHKQARNRYNAPCVDGISKKTRKACEGWTAIAAMRCPPKPGADSDTIIIAEGPETALSLWHATGTETFATFGIGWIGKAPVPEGKRVIVAVDQGSEDDARKQADRLADRGYSVSLAYPREYADIMLSDFNDVLKRDGVGAVRECIAAAVPVSSPAVTLERVVTFDELLADVQAMEPKRLLTPTETKAFAAKVIESGVGYTDVRYLFQMVKDRTRTTISALDGAMNEVRGSGIVAPGGGSHHITPAVRAMCDRYIFVKETGQLFDRRTRKFYAVDAVRRAHRSEMPLTEYGSPIDPEDFLFSPHTAAETVDGVSYWPGQPETVYEGAEKCVNTWTRPTLEAVEGDVAHFINHVNYICDGDEVVAGHLLDYLAYIVAVPGGKVRWMPLIISTAGIGKKVLFDSIEHAIGPKNFRSISNNQLASEFNGYLRSASLVVIPELRIGDRVEVMNQLKPWITDDTIEINDKGVRTFSMRNRANFLAFSNYKDATVLDDGDRRFFIHISKAQPKPKEYYDTYFDWLDQGGREAIYHWLCHRDLTKFEPNGRAPNTASKAIVAAASIPAWESYLQEKFDIRSHPFAHDLISTSAVVEYLKTERGQSYTVHQVGRFLGKVGGEKLENVRMDAQRKATLWAVRELADKIRCEGMPDHSHLAAIYVAPGESWATGGALA